MSIPKVDRKSPVSRDEFDTALRDWSKAAVSGEMVGDSPEYGGKAWVHVTYLGRRYFLNADSTCEGVREYVDLLTLNPAIDWHVIPNRRGRWNKVAFGTEQRVISKFYLYMAED